jgi:hypothetical protein
MSLALDPAPVTADPLPAGEANVADEPAPAEATGAAQVPPATAGADGAAETAADDPPAAVLGREAPHAGVTGVAAVAVDEDPTAGGVVVGAVVVPVVVVAVFAVVVVVVVVVAGVVVVTDPFDGAVAVDPFGAVPVVVLVDVPPGALPDVPGKAAAAAVDDDADVDPPAGVVGAEVLSCIAAPAPLKLAPAGAGVPASADAAAHRSVTADIAAQMPAL